MTPALRVLDLIEEFVVEHSGDLAGATLRVDDRLDLFDGRVTLRSEVETDPSRPGTAHVHILTMLHEYDDEVLDACVFGIGNDENAALSEASMIWLTAVAGPIKSFLDKKPVCMSCEAGVVGGDSSKGYSQGDYGLRGLRAYVGPYFARGVEDQNLHSTLDDKKPWFRWASESAAPRRVHLVKASIVAKGKDGWSRQVEIDGHEVAHQDPNWLPGLKAPESGYLIRFAVFEFPPNSVLIKGRAELDRTILHFAENYAKYEDVDQLMDAMVQQGFDPDHVHDTEAISTIAFSRAFFEQTGIQTSPTIIRARCDGRIETDVPLMSIPAFSRASALMARLWETMTREELQALCLYNAESHVIVQALEKAGDQGDLDLSQMQIYPCVVPDRGVSDQTMDAALEKLNEIMDRNRPPQKTKPKWKFW